MEANKKNIVFVSVSSDLYGASKLLLSIVGQLKKFSLRYNPIVCMPSDDGPLKSELKTLSVEIIEMPVLLLTRSMLKSLSFIRLYKEYKRARTIFEEQINGRSIYAIQSNTLVTLFGAFYCRNKPIPHIIHIHEIADRPWFIKYFFGWILSHYTDHIVYNSRATKEFYNNFMPSLINKSKLIYNGVDREQPPLSASQISALQKQLFGVDNLFLIGLVGRINRLKGHQVLLEAYYKIKNQIPRSKLCFIGSPPTGQDHFKEGIEERINELNLSNDVILLPFQSNIYSVIDTLDILVVPSTEPESFGIIAVEGMLSNKAVIASNIGGLANIVTDGEDGLLVPPSNPERLGEAIIKLVEDEDLKKRIKIKARQSALEKFSTSRMIGKFNALYEEIG